MFLTSKKNLIEVGYFFAIVAAILGGLADVLPKNILDDTDSTYPISMTGLMFLINGVFFTLVIQGYNKFQKKNKSIISYKNLIKTRKKSFYFLVFAGLTEIIATVVFYFGLKETSAANSAVLGNADILFTWIFAFLILRECVKRNELFPIALILVGSIILPTFVDNIIKGTEFEQLDNGDILVIFSGVFYGIEMILLKYISEKVNTARIIELISYIGGFTALVIAVLIKSPLNFEDFNDLIVISITGIFGIGISILFMVLAIQYIGSIRTILIFSTTTIFGIIFASVYLKEDISEIHWASFAFVFVGICILRKKLAEE